MKNIVIAAGYATRLGELTRNFPKPLLEIGSSTILGRMLDDIDTIPDITEHIVITNHKFAGIFEEWAGKQRYTKPVTIIDDGTETNETRLGAVCDLLYAMDRLKIDDDMLVVAADNLLFFSFREFVAFAKEKDSSCIMCHEQPDIEKLRRTGVIVVNKNMKVLDMEEKPAMPKSHWAVPPFYIYLKKDLDLIRHSVENGCGKDAPGNLAHYMVQNTDIYAWPMSGGRFDIGSIDTYKEACMKFGNMEFTQNFIDGLLKEAEGNPRLRTNVDLRNSGADGSQRMLNALLPGTKVDIHRHLASSESVICICGRLDEVFYDDNGKETGRIRLSPAEGRYGCQVPAGVWHTVEVFEPSVIIEAKDGRYGEDGSERL